MLGIRAGQGHSLLAGVEADRFRGAPVAQGIEAEAAAVAKHVQHAASAAVVGCHATIVALIEIEASLLSFAQIDAEAQLVFANQNGSARRLAPQQSISML